MTNILVSACLLGTDCKYNGGSNENLGVRKLLERPDVCLIPTCPEQLGGLPTPRVPAERQGNRVVSQDGRDVTAQYCKGAAQAVKLAKLFDCKFAILKEKSPSCGFGAVYDGSFSHKVVAGNGVTADELTKLGILIFGESQLDQLTALLDGFHTQKG